MVNATAREETGNPVARWGILGEQHMTDLTAPVSAPLTTETTFFGATISGTITSTAHVWTANAIGLFTTTTDLASEWMNLETMMQTNPAALTFVQRLEANAEVVFQNTGLNALSAAAQAQDRMDAQREFDAIGAAITEYNAGAAANGETPINPYGTLTTQGYLGIENTLRSDPVLQELALQGHGLNDPSSPKYNGYTNDFQNNVDTTTLYIGGGLDKNEAAVPNLMDDAILSHLPFPVVEENGVLEQLNQNGAAEDTLPNAVAAINMLGGGFLLTASDFATSAGNPAVEPIVPARPSGQVPMGEMVSLFGVDIPTTLIANGHTWVADPDGLYLTTANLSAEWLADYNAMQTPSGYASLTPAQRLEGNAEAVFMNTGLATLAVTNADQYRYDQMDVQREIDAIATAMTEDGLGSAPLTQANYLTLEETLQNNTSPTNAALEELAIQGHGLRNSPYSRYDGYTNDFQTNVDQKTLYVGPGLDSGERALTNFVDDVIMTHMPYPVVAENGELVQLNENGNADDTVQAEVDGLNESMFSLVLTAADFNIPGNPPGVAAPAVPVQGPTTTTIYGVTIPSTMTVNGDVWTIGTDGQFHTTTDLESTWLADYNALQTWLATGSGPALTPIQHLIGNAEAIFLNTSLATLKPAQQQAYREDAQREFDAIAAVMAQLGLGATMLTDQDYLLISQTMQANPALEELAMEGHGLNSPPLTKYDGYTNDFQNNSDNSTYFVGGGLDSGETAVPNLFDDAIMTHLPFPEVSINGVLTQLNQNADDEDPVDVTVAAMNSAMFQRVYVAADFSKNKNAVGPVDYFPGMQNATPPASPTPGTNQMLSFTGFVIPDTIVANGDTWVADANGRYETTTDLALQWYDAYQMALAGDTLTLTQHWEANAEAVFLNTSLSQLSDGQQAIDRADTQREIDAVVTVMTSLGLGSSPLTVAQYQQVEQALQDDPALEELAVQGYGLDNPWVAGATEYNGFTNDFENNVDGHTLFVGGGLNDGQRAIANFFAVNIMSLLAFPTTPRNGEIEQLNQNGNAEETLSASVAALNATLFTQIYTASDFLVPGAQAAPAPAAPPATVTTLMGDTISSTITIDGHTWTVDANGEFQTSTNLEIEWRTDYQLMLAGGTLTVAQRMEANAEAVFENTNITWESARQEAAARADVQREIDAIVGAMQIDQTTYGIDPTQPLTEAGYIQLGETLQGNAALEELALQGHGVPGTSLRRYGGAYADFVSGADWSTYFVGGGPDNGKLALPYFFNDVESNLMFPTADVNGLWEQLDMYGNVLETVPQAALALNNTMYYQVYVAADFSQSAGDVGPVVLVPSAQPAPVVTIAQETAPTGQFVGLSGQYVDDQVTIAITPTVSHTWTADQNGLFHTANLANEWTTLYAEALAGTQLNAIQQAEANAEAVFEATGLTKLSAAQQQVLREDVQRELDAMAGAFIASGLGIPTSPTLLAGAYVPMERALHDSADLEELAVQGFGLTNAPTSEKIRYSGWINDISAQNRGVNFIGGGVDNNTNALTTFMPENIMTFTPFAVIWQNGKLVQLNQNGQVGATLATAIQAAADTMFNRTYKKTDFH